MQAALKHGTKERTPSGRIKHELPGGLTVVSSRDQAVGVTGFRRDAPAPMLSVL